MAVTNIATSSFTILVVSWLAIVFLHVASTTSWDFNQKVDDFRLEIYRKLQKIQSKNEEIKKHAKVQEGFRVELIHRDSPFSPTGNSNMTTMERLHRAVKHSQERAQTISKAATFNEASKVTVQPSFTSPVSTDQGAYFMLLQLGTPPHTFHSIVDTGSDLVWLQCQPCVQCYSQQDPVFSPASSSTYTKLSCSSQTCQQLSSNTMCLGTCMYTYQYGDQSSTSGDLSSETITLTTTAGGHHRISNVAFGCGHNNMGTFGGAAGIVGLGQGPVSLTSQLASQIQRKFSYCLVSFYDAPSKTSPLLFGSAASLPETNIKSTPILRRESTCYYVALNGISVGERQLSLDLKGGTIVDSGTTLTLLPDAAYSTVRAAFQQAIKLPLANSSSSAGLDLCYNIKGLSSYTVPSLSLHLTNADMNPPVDNYFLLVDPNTLCLAMDTSGNLGLTILGNILQQNYHVLYDRSSSTLSFAPTECDKL